MRRRLSDVVVFVVGASVLVVASDYSGGWPVALSMAVRFLCPGFLLGRPLAALLPDMGLEGIGLQILIMALTNGALCSLAWYLCRIAMKGSRATLAAVTLAVGVWTLVYARWSAVNWPKPEPPPKPVDLSSSLAGRWEGVAHGARGDRAVILVLHPRTDGTLDGFLYESGYLFGPFYRGGFVGDSVHFDVGSLEQRGRRDGDRMTLESTMSGSSQTMELRFVSADTSRLALPPLEP